MQEYPGLVPSNVSKDAKYSVRMSEGKWRVSLLYRLDSRERELLTTDAHPELVEMVNQVKVAVTGTPGGAFYINEYHHVVVPADGGAYWAGDYNGVLAFSFEGGVISPEAPHGLEPGDLWAGPHVGIRYVLAAGGKDVKYELKLSPTRTRTVMLSHEVGKGAAAGLASRLAAVKGSTGGRIYINERSEFFGPPSGGGDHLYLGHLDDDDWFPGPDLPTHDAG